jgi:hypothetical protein
MSTPSDDERCASGRLLRSSRAIRPRSAQGMAVERKIVEHADKQRTLKRS